MTLTQIKEYYVVLDVEDELIVYNAIIKDGKVEEIDWQPFYSSEDDTYCECFHISSLEDARKIRLKAIEEAGQYNPELDSKHIEKIFEIRKIVETSREVTTVEYEYEVNKISL
jgi:hypothetical protein